VLVKVLPTLIERSEQLRHLDGVLDIAAARDGACTLLYGPAGIGKTALLEQLCARARVRDFATLTATGSELEHDFPYGVVRQLYEGALSRLERSTRERLLSGAAHCTAAIFDRTEPPESMGLDVSFAVMHGLYWLLADLAEKSPILIVVDDAQWSDVASLRHLLYVARRLDGLPVALVIAQRDGEPIDRPLQELGELGWHSTLPPLSPSGVATLLESAFGEVPTPGFTEACHQQTGGNPLYVTALVQEAMDRGLKSDDGTIVELGRGSIARLATHVLRRIDACGPQARTVAGLATVLDRAASTRRIAQLAEMPTTRVAELLGELADRDILARGEAVRFSHPVVQEAVYAQLRSAERDGWHRNAAKLIQQEDGDTSEISRHLLECLPAGEAWVVEQLRAAARQAFAQGAPESAVSALRRALDEPPKQALRGIVLRELAHAESATGEWKSACEHLQVAVSLATDIHERAEITLEHAGILALSSRYRSAVQELESCLGSLEDCDQGAEEALRQRLDAELISYALIDDASRERGLERLVRYEGRVPEGPAAQASLTAMAMGALAMNQSSEAVCDLAAQALEIADLRAGHFAEELWCAAAWVLIMADRPRQAYAIAAKELVPVRREGDVRKLCVVEIVLAYAALRLGRVPEAVARARTALEVVDRGTHENWAHSVQALGLIEAGELEEADQILTQTPADWWSIEVTGSYLLLEAQLLLDLALGRLADAHKPLAELDRRALLMGEGMRYCDDVRFCQGALLAHREGEVEPARELAEQALVAAQSFGSVRVVGEALRVAGLVGATERSAGELLEASVQTLEGSPFALEHARSLVELGGGLRRAGSRVEAREPLKRGLEIAFRAGAAPIVTRATEELHASGARPRRAVRSGVDALTAAELRVAELVCAGRANREIAQDLYVTLKTVEGHLGRVYRKLNLSGRAARSQLPQALFGAAEVPPAISTHPKPRTPALWSSALPRQLL
jgi:DNA-binding CsgD family transcriptional regulator